MTAPDEPESKPPRMFVVPADFLHSLVGLERDEAVKRCEENGHTWRITKIDGVDQPVTRDIRRDRVDLHITDGRVSWCYRG